MIETNYLLQVRAFPVVIRDELSGEVTDDVIVLDKARLQAAQMVGQSSKELIERLYDQNCYKVLSIGKAEKLNWNIPLGKLYMEVLAQELHLDEIVDRINRGKENREAVASADSGNS